MNFSPMSDLSKWRYRLSVAISLSIVVLVDLLGDSVGFSSAVSARPRPSAPVVTSQATKSRISPQPVEAVLANLQLKSSRSKTGDPNPHRSSKQSSQAATRQIKTDRSRQGIAHLIDTDRQTDFSPVDRLIK